MCTNTDKQTLRCVRTADHERALEDVPLLAPDGSTYESAAPGTLGGNSRLKIYGRLDRKSALRYVAAGTYQPHRVFFADEREAILAGYRPCGNCMRSEYAEWKKGGPIDTMD